MSRSHPFNLTVYLKSVDILVVWPHCGVCRRIDASIDTDPDTPPQPTLFVVPCWLIIAILSYQILVLMPRHCNFVFRRQTYVPTQIVHHTCRSGRSMKICGYH